MGNKLLEFDVIVEKVDNTTINNVQEKEKQCEISENRRPFHKNRKWGFKDHKDEVVIEPIYTSVKEFIEGRAVVEIDGMWGLIDNVGNKIIETKYDEISYDGSYMCAVNDMGKWGVIDRTGKVVSENKWNWIGEFSCGLAMVEINELCGYINQQGEVVIEPIYKNATSFDSDGFAKVTLGEEQFEIDTLGNKIP